VIGVIGEQPVPLCVLYLLLSEPGSIFGAAIEAVIIVVAETGWRWRRNTAYRRHRGRRVGLF